MECTNYDPAIVAVMLSIIVVLSLLFVGVVIWALYDMTKIGKDE